MFSRQMMPKSQSIYLYLFLVKLPQELRDIIQDILKIMTNIYYIQFIGVIKQDLGCGISKNFYLTLDYNFVKKVQERKLDYFKFNSFADSEDTEENYSSITYSVRKLSIFEKIVFEHYTMNHSNDICPKIKEENQFHSYCLCNINSLMIYNRECCKPNIDVIFDNNKLNSNIEFLCFKEIYFYSLRKRLIEVNSISNNDTFNLITQGLL